MSDLPAPAGVLPTDMTPAKAAPLATLDGHAMAILAYARERFRSSWHDLTEAAQADVEKAARDLAHLTLDAAKGADAKAVTLRMLEARATMRGWSWTGRRAAAKHLQRGAAHIAWNMANGLAGDERRAALRHSAALMNAKPSRAKRKR